jgi:hypothetical protein
MASPEDMEMKAKLPTIFIGLVVASIVFATAAFAQSGSGRGGWVANSRYGRLYNPATIETVTGEVASVAKFTPARGMSPGIHLRLNTGHETISVHLGPAWFIDKQGFGIAPGDTLEVTGSRITFDGKPAIIAAELKKDGQVMMLRDRNGVPAWRGWRRRPR